MNIKNIGATCALSVATIFSSFAVQAEISGQVAVNTAGRTVSVVNHQAIGQALASDVEYGVKAASGFKWGRKDAHVESVDRAWAVNTVDNGTSFKWGSTKKVIDNTSNTVASTAGYKWNSSSFAEQAGFRWTNKNFADQAGFRWTNKSFSEQAGFRWTNKSFAEQAGFRWTNKSFAEQAGFRWTNKSFSEQAGFRWTNKSFSEQAGFRWTNKNFSEQAGFRWTNKSAGTLIK